MRADGRVDLDVRATLETEDGHRIAAQIDGVATPRANEPIVDPVEYVRLATAASKYGWINSRQIWGLGTVNLADGEDTRRGVYAVKKSTHATIASFRLDCQRDASVNGPCALTSSGYRAVPRLPG
ncbi:DUF3237 domain-containing protein [Bradyrhizobium cenepequi]|uniref:DUF3237 domain-containing protein n=1 Tax=Bradyrhizobium cenepequi TaxID=2821403 RepID=UPI00201C3A11